MNPAVKLAFVITAVMVVLASNPNTAGQNPKAPDPARHAEENERDLEQRMSQDEAIYDADR